MYILFRWVLLKLLYQKSKSFDKAGVRCHCTADFNLFYIAVEKLEDTDIGGGQGDTCCYFRKHAVSGMINNDFAKCLT